MKVLIDIPEQDYELVCNYPEVLFGSYAKFIKNGIVIPDNTTNGDIIKTMFPEYEETRMCGDVRYGSKEYANLEFVVDEDWWDTPYKRGSGNE